MTPPRGQLTILRVVGESLGEREPGLMDLLGARRPVTTRSGQHGTLEGPGRGDLQDAETHPVPVADR